VKRKTSRDSGKKTYRLGIEQSFRLDEVSNRVGENNPKRNGDRKERGRQPVLRKGYRKNEERKLVSRQVRPSITQTEESTESQ